MGTDAPRSKGHRRIRRLLIALGVVLSLVLVTAGLGVWTVTRSFPTLSGSVDIEGLSNPVTVTRDEAGIPQITAKTAADLFLAEGYVHAQDRFWEMDFRRHVTSGRLSELFGESQVGTDTFVRTLGWRAVAEQEVALLDPVALGYYQSYADGVNAYLDTHDGADLSLEYAVLGLQNPGYEVEPWTPADSVAWLKAMAWDLRSNLDDEIDRALLSTTLTPTEVNQLHPEYPAGAHPTITGSQTVVVPSAGAPEAAEPTGEPTAEPSASTGLDSTVEPASASVDSYAGALTELRAALSTIPELLGPAGGEIGSNSWVVAGSLTNTGMPLLANDPHLGPALPSVWYQVGLRCQSITADCPFDVAGYSFSGLPGVIIGHTERIAWGFTNLGPDVADLYIEKITGDSYEFDGAAKPLLLRDEKISVAGGDDVKIEIRSTEHGPLLSGFDGTTYQRIASDYPKAAGLPTASSGAESGAEASGVDLTTYELSLQWTALTPGRTASAIFALNQATDWTSFRAAAELFEVPAQNLTYADVEGNIGYQAPGLVPIRASGNGTLPVPGWTSEYGWTGYIPFDALPSTFNPPSGYIVTANNAAADPGSPNLLTADWDLGYRANQITARLQELIAVGTPLTAELMSDIQGDNYSAIAAALVPRLQEVRLTGSAAEAQQLLDGWDYQVDADSAAAAYFNVIWRTLLKDMFTGKVDDGAHLTGGDRAFSVVTSLLSQPDSPWWSNPTYGTVGQESMLRRVMTNAAAESADLMGSDPTDWQWGSIHTLELKNASFGESGIAPLEWLFNRGPYELAGGPAVVNAVGWDATQGYQVDWVPSMRQVISLENFDDSTWINLTGASGHAFHSNYTDQAPLWRDHETRPWLFTPATINDDAADTLTLEPAA
ncbi:penicillin acylase family protein [Cryobacterium sp. TMS1-13-1]|uniref:penicillin acylase family protein n=1 Tax=Cryobacterium sp. TMS1-13-1 TaxID=1259220 RepID=UPI00106CBD2D|nr:penicillin acylase family protein [Cryobacterium sp. TMS1-13-1]TFD24313.1 penicillin acylase family protein [Cryobacterium sp. TMS1-13-1]